MSKVKMALALSALAAMLCAPWDARADTQVGQSTNALNDRKMVGGRIRNTQIAVDQQFDADSNLYVTEGNPSQNFLVRRSNWYQGRLVVGNTDTTGEVVNTTGANHIYLEILGTTDSVSCNAVFGIQVRRHSNTLADSVSTFPVQRWGNLAVDAPGAFLTGATDSIGSTISTTNYVATGTTAQQDELVYVVTGISVAPVPRGKSIELLDRNGAPLTAAYLSLRVRCLQVNVQGAAGTGTCTPTASRSASIKINLVGTR